MVQKQENSASSSNKKNEKKIRRLTTVPQFNSTKRLMNENKKIKSLVTYK